MPNLSQSTRTLYRSRCGLIFGVCRGIAEYAEISVFWVRFGAILACLFTGFWPMVLLYIAAAIFLKPAPVIAFTDDEDWDFYQSYVTDRKRALWRLKRQCESLDRRTRRMETIVTDKAYDWERRFQSGT